mgnify:CR=1 FL=1
MRNYKSITDYIEYPKVDAIEDIGTSYIYSLDYCTGECYSMNHEDDLKGIETYFFKLPDYIELYWDEPSFYA